MTKPKRIEFTTVGGCKSCDIALHDLLPMAKEKSIPVHVLPLTEGEVFLPKTCVIKEVNGVEVKKCTEGWNQDYKKDVEKLIDE